MKKKAFTLIELLVVLALVSLLISVVGPSGKRMYDKFSKGIDRVEEVGKEHDRQFIRFLEDKHYFEVNKSMDINKSEVNK